MFTDQRRFNRILVLVTILYSVTGCSGSEKSDTTDDRPRRQVNTEQKQSCADLIQDVQAPNLGLAPDFGLPAPSQIYIPANLGERDLCSSLEYFRDAISFNPEDNDSTDQRVENLRSSFYFLHTSVGRATFGLEVDQSFRNNQSDLYFANLILEGSEFAEQLAREGAQLLIALADASKASVGDYEELTGVVWGVSGGNIEVPVDEGLRAGAYGFLQGRPWRNIIDFDDTLNTNSAVPSCRVSAEDPVVRRAINLLREHGLAVKPKIDPFGTLWVTWKDGSDDFGSQVFTDSINAPRVAAGLTTLTYDEILVQLELTDEALSLASRYLFDELPIYLRDLDIAVLNSGVRLVKGIVGTENDLQLLTARSRAGFFAANTPGPIVVAAVSGLSPLLSNISDVAKCVLGSLPEHCQRSAALIVPGAFSAEVKSKMRLAESNIATFLGKRSFTYSQQVVGSNVAWATPSIEIVADGFAGEQIQIYSVQKNGSDLVPEYYKLLACLRFAEDPATDCAPPICVGTCTIPTPPSNEEIMLVVSVDGTVVDMYSERRPQDIGAMDTALIHSRHYIDPGLLSELERNILARDPGDCSKPRLNALGLPLRMPIPTENELVIGGSPTYSDAFSFYIERAKQAANDASRLVTAAVEGENNLEAAVQRMQNLRQDAADRIEQICGVGRTDCSTPRVNRTLGALGILPDAGAEGCDPLPDPPTIGIFNDIATLTDGFSAFVRCRAKVFIDALEPLVIDGLPTPIEEAILTGTITEETFDWVGGEYRTRLLEIKTGFVDLRSAVASMNTSLETLTGELEINKLNFVAMGFELAALVAEIVAGGLSGPAGGFQSAAAAARAAAQQLKMIASQHQFLNQMIEKISAIEQATLTVEKAATGIQTAILSLDGLELEQTQAGNRAERMAAADLAQYVGTTDDQLKSFRRVTLLKSLRARRAVRRAKKMAFIARRALEQKLAVDLTQEKEPPIIGDPPAKWVDDVFTMFVATSLFDPEDDPTLSAVSYVQRLEDYVFNYPFQFPFADGQDVAILSLRDDLSILDSSCSLAATEFTNLIDSSEEFDRWFVVDPQAPGETTVESDVAFGPEQTGRPTADRLRYDCLVNPRDPANSGCQTLSSNAVPGTADDPDTYTASVHLRLEIIKGTEQTAEIILRLVGEYRSGDANGPIVGTPVANSVKVSLNASQDWQRIPVTLSSLVSPSSVPGADLLTLRIEIVPNLEAVGGGAIGDELPGPGLSEPTIVLLAWGAQIEAGGLSAYEPKPNFVLDPTCQEETVIDALTGETRTVRFVPPLQRSVRLRDSFSVKCVEDEFAQAGQIPEDCILKGGVDYLERPFIITLEGIENGEIIQQGQIGAGNYNYRIDSLAINLVGSNVKDCSLDPAAGTSCYTNLFIPYDLLQDGSVKIRNHAEIDLPFDLAVGRIHQGKGIAAERLLTNPLSSTDQGIVQQYLKSEFRGRPIQGVYTLRIYATPSLRWDNIEDVQILMNYRYWSSFSNP